MTSDWRQDVACRGMNPDLFFPQKGDLNRYAKSVCRECPVSDDCLDFALTGSGEKFGIWGALTEKERRRLRRKRGIRLETVRSDLMECGTAAGAQRHYRRGEKPCEACRVAHNLLQSDRKAAKTAARKRAS